MRLRSRLADHEDGGKQPARRARGRAGPGGPAARRRPRPCTCRPRSTARKATAGQAAGQQRPDQAGRLAVGIRFPGMQRRQPHLGAEADQQKDEAGMQPGPGEQRPGGQQVVEQQADGRSAAQAGIGHEEQAEHGQGDAHRADQQVLPGGLDGEAVAVEVDQRRAGQGGRLDGHPQQAQMVGMAARLMRRQEDQQAGHDHPVAAVATHAAGSRPRRRRSRRKSRLATSRTRRRQRIQANPVAGGGRRRIGPRASTTSSRCTAPASGSSQERTAVPGRRSGPAAAAPAGTRIRAASMDSFLAGPKAARCRGTRTRG